MFEMATLHPIVRMTLHAENGAFIDSIELSANEWYDGECEVIDSPEARVRRGIRRIEGEQTNPKGLMHKRWRNTYDGGGVLLEMDEWDGADGR